MRLTISLEVALYVAIGVLALALRLAELDVFPLSNAEAHEALAAWHAVRIDAPGLAPLAHSPLMFAFNSLVFGAAGSSDYWRASRRPSWDRCSCCCRDCGGRCWGAPARC